jgi:hypothetical protein
MGPLNGGSLTDKILRGGGDGLIATSFPNTMTGHRKGCPATSAGNYFDSHYKLQAPVPPEVPPTHNNPHMPLDNDSFANNGVTASPLPFSPHLPREL